MKIAILDPASGIAGDMFIGALVDNGLDKSWLERLPETLGLDGVGVRRWSAGGGWEHIAGARGSGSIVRQLRR